MYVDDVFSGANSLSQALAYRDQLISLLGTAGMDLGKWAANDARLLQGLSEGQTFVQVAMESAVSALGVRWHPRSDDFAFSLALPPTSSVVTKRIILSETAKLFDPLGWLAPVIVIPKILLQDIWVKRIDWDAPLPEDLLARWRTFRHSLEDLERLRIPRLIETGPSQKWSLHGFCDASKRAYAGVIYALNADGKSALLMAKTKVAPLRVQSLPRLELCGALLLVRLARYLVNKLRVAPTDINFWTDSKVVLDWLKAHPSKWQVFVANRVSEIQSTFPSASWRHVVSADNPADPASRGMYPYQLHTLELW